MPIVGWTILTSNRIGVNTNRCTELLVQHTLGGIVGRSLAAGEIWTNLIARDDSHTLMPHASPGIGFCDMFKDLAPENCQIIPCAGSSAVDSLAHNCA